MENKVRKVNDRNKLNWRERRTLWTRLKEKEFYIAEIEMGAKSIEHVTARDRGSIS